MAHTTPIQADPEFVAMLTEVLDNNRPAADREPGQLDRDLWSLLEELGLTRLTGAESRGGSEGSWHDAAALHEAVAAHGVQLPLAEHDLLAHWLLETLDIPTPEGIFTLALLDTDGTARNVPWARHANHIVVVRPDGADRYLVGVLDTADLTIEPGLNLAGEQRDSVSAPHGIPGEQPLPDDTVVALRNRAALVRAIQLCGAMDAAIAATVQHVTDRVQFGRALSAFQAVQHRLADAAAEAALGRAATQAALDEAVATDFHGEGLPVSIAVARSCAGHAGSAVVRAVHQLHGAIGTTREHHLHQLTGPILAWANEFGTVAEFDRLLTEAVLDSAAESGTGCGVWSLVSDSVASAPRGP